MGPLISTLQHSDQRLTWASPSMAPAGYLFNDLSDEQWLQVLIRSVKEPVIDGVEMPRFPHGSVQLKICGSKDEHTLREAYQFYHYVKEWSGALGRRPNWGSRLLDFGCGWGRCTRFFWKDIASDGIFGVDVNYDLVMSCGMLGVPGSFSKIEPQGTLPFPDESFDLIIAYSVFTHLPEDIANHWIAELARVARPGAVFALTVEPRRFLQFIRDIPPDAAHFWYRDLARFKKKVAGLMTQYDAGQYCYIPTGGREPGLDPSVYGEAAIPPEYMKRRWGSQFELRGFVDEPAVFWQAFVVLRRP